MDTSTLEPGSVLDEYIVDELIAGADGETYRARRQRDARNVVIQLFTPRSPQLLQRFLEHAQTASRVRHPALASVQGFGQFGDTRCYLVSELVQGQPLDAWADAIGIPPLVQVMELVRRLGLGLQAAARAGITHAAIDPSHVIVLKPTPGPEPRLPVKLLDLGVPAFLRSEPLPGEALRFMAPETLRELEQSAQDTEFEFTGAMNVYSCGCLLYYLCTGGPPYPGSTIDDLLAAHSVGRLAPPMRINPEISPALNGVILRALSLDPAARFASVAGLVDALGTAGVSMRASKSMRLTGGVSVVAELPQPPVHVPNALDAEEPPTFRTTRPPELFASLSDRADEHTSNAPTMPPLAIPAANSAPGNGGSAPIGLFSSAPPEHERRSPTPPPPFHVSSERPTPLALFTEPQPVRPSEPGVLVVPAQPTTSRIVSPYETDVTHGGKLGRRILVQFAWPLAACACIAAYFVVRLLLVPPAEPVATTTPAADSGDAQRVANVRVEPSGAQRTEANHERPAPQSQPGAVIAHAPEPTPLATPPSSAAHAPTAATDKARERERDRSRSHTRDRGARDARPGTTNAPAATPVIDSAVAHEEVVSVEQKPEPPETATASAATTPPAPVAVVKPVQPKPKPELPASVESRPARNDQPLQASAAIDAVAVHGSLPTSLVRRAVERIRPQLSACYARSAEAAGRNAFGDVTVDVKIDERGRARDPHATGARLAGLNSCVAQAAARVVSEKAPDTGTVSVSFKVAFTP